MNEDTRKAVKNISISGKSTIIDALKKMDQKNVKLLLILDDDLFKGVISIGDIQRAIISNVPFETSISSISRKNYTVAHSNESRDDIVDLMFKERIECMPIVDDKGSLTDILFWEDIFSSQESLLPDLDIPCVIMAGGQGTRLQPLTNVIPKPLVPVGKKTIIEHIIERMHSSGITKYYITVNYKHEMLEFYLDQLDLKNITIECLLEDKPLGTGGSLSFFKNKINTSFIVSNCDIIVDQDYKDIYSYHKSNNNDITIIAAIKHLSIPYGVVESGDNGILSHIAEKPDLNIMINSGMYILEPHLIDLIPEGQFFHLTDLINLVQEKNGRVGVFPVSEKSWFDIGEWDEYQKTLTEFDLRFNDGKK